MSLRLASKIRNIKLPPYAISFDAPFTRSSLAQIAKTLPQNLIDSPLDETELQNQPYVPKTASVLLALANVENTPSIVLEVRGQLRTHSGEISFPGGKVDEVDANFAAGAIRETVEEIGVSASQVQILGRLTPITKSLHGLDVHCFVGYIYPTGMSKDSVASHGDDDPLPSLSMDSLTRSANEVAQIFHLPLSYTVDPKRLRAHNLPNRPQYWAIDVADKIDQAAGVILPPPPWFDDPKEHAGQPRAEIWGLTGWYMNQFLKRLGAY
ncbi:hypothetical protein DL93DRAFT_2115995 [Clavulina sp. PMI_390]|nr:hypothetical protein DL93DRAFT_2115995 [Clavulina sp. PMI_390]